MTEIMSAFRLLAQSETAKQHMTITLVGPEAGVLCALKWRKDVARVASCKATLWMPSPGHFGCKRQRLDPDGDASMTGCDPGESSFSWKSAH